jgi:hypothetical protein
MISGFTTRLRCAVEEVDDGGEFVIAVVGADPRERGVHSGVEADQLAAAVAEDPDADSASVGVVAVTGDPSTALEPVEDTRHGGWVQSGLACKGAGAERTFLVDDIEAEHIDGPEPDVAAHAVIENGQLGAELAQRCANSRREAPPPAYGTPRPFFVVHILCFPYRTSTEAIV